MKEVENNNPVDNSPLVISSQQQLHTRKSDSAQALQNLLEDAKSLQNEIATELAASLSSGSIEASEFRVIEGENIPPQPFDPNASGDMGKKDNTIDLEEGEIDSSISEWEDDFEPVANLIMDNTAKEKCICQAIFSTRPYKDEEGLSSEIHFSNYAEVHDVVKGENLGFKANSTQKSGIAEGLKDISLVKTGGPVTSEKMERTWKSYLEIQKFRRAASYFGIYCLFSGLVYAYTNNTTRAGISRADQFYSSYPAGVELLSDTTKLYKAALGNLHMPIMLNIWSIFFQMDSLMVQDCDFRDTKNQYILNF
ncbi:hypothetical protein SUGI_0176990 [Cryptomeria japonica]|nr:hypothetical protein SUGI_0176990 [Cryptomeria japonica]